MKRDEREKIERYKKVIRSLGRDAKAVGMGINVLIMHLTEQEASCGYYSNWEMQYIRGKAVGIGRSLVDSGYNLNDFLCCAYEGYKEKL